MIQLRQIGDVLLTTPAVKALREYYPHSRITYLSETGPATLLQGNPHIDRMITRDRKGGFWQEVKLVQELRKAKYDLVIDFFCNPRSAWLSFLTGAPHRVARYHAGRSWWYTCTPKATGKTGYSAEDKLALLEAIGIEAPLVPPVLNVPESAREYIEKFLKEQDIRNNGWRKQQISPFNPLFPSSVVESHDKEQEIRKKPCTNSGSFVASKSSPVITIDLTSRRQAKQWIPERYVQLADRLTERYGATSIFIWGQGEREMVENLLKQGKHRHLLACPTDLMQLAALIEQSDLHIGNCSAPRHIAVAVGTPSLTVMGPTKAANWTYPSPQHRFIRGNVPCLECHRTVCERHDCMKILTVEEVEEAVQELFDRLYSYSE